MAKSIQEEIQELEARGYFNLEKWERAKLANLRQQLKQEALAPKLAAKREAHTKRVVQRFVREMSDLDPQMGRDIQIILDKHKL